MYKRTWFGVVGTAVVIGVTLGVGSASGATVSATPGVSSGTAVQQQASAPVSATLVPQVAPAAGSVGSGQTTMSLTILP